VTSTKPILLWDLDGTLADTAPDLTNTMNVLLQRHGRPTVPIERVRHLVGGGARLLMERGFKETGEPASEALLDQLFQEFLVHYGDHVADHSEVWPGLRDQLDRLQEMGIPMAVCTNKVEELSHKALAALDLAKYFPVVIGGDTLPVKKLALLLFASASDMPVCRSRTLNRRVSLITLMTFRRPSSNSCRMPLPLFNPLSYLKSHAPGVEK
jgi:phosphoglycolate phosphatase-like HAD superfamily hydrolase